MIVWYSKLRPPSQCAKRSIELIEIQDSALGSYPLTIANEIWQVSQQLEECRISISNVV